MTLDNSLPIPVWRKLWFAVTVGIIILLFSLTPFGEELIAAVDGRLAIWFNSLVGKSPVLDRLVLLVADDEGRQRIVALAAAWFLVAVLMAQGRVAKSRLLGTFFYITIVLVLYFLVDSLLDDVIERKSPSMGFLQPFNHIGRVMGFKVDVTDRRSFPSKEAMLLLTMGFMLLRLRRPGGAVVALSVGLVLPLFLCIAGLSWFSDTYVGALPIAFLVSAVAVETPFKAVHESMIDLAAAGLDQSSRKIASLVPIWRHRRLYWTSQNVFHVEVAVKRFVKREMPAILDPEQKYPHHSPQLEVPLGGLRSVVRIATLGDQKAIVRAYPLNRRIEADQHVRASTYLREQSVNVPEMYKVITNPSRYGAIFLVEEFIRGRSKTADELTDADIKEMATQLARLHNVTSTVWGPLDHPRSEGYANVLLRRIDRQISTVVRGPVLGDKPAYAASARAWFASWRAELEKITEFSLTHGKLHRENSLFTGEGRYYLLDTTTLEWEVAASDYVTVRHSQCDGKANIMDKLDAAYFAALHPSVAARCRELLPLYEALYCLSQAQKNTKRLRRAGKQPSQKMIQKGIVWWATLQEIILKTPRA